MRICHHALMTLEPTIAVTTLERALRQLMAREYQREYGTDWLERVSSPEQRDKWHERVHQEIKRRPGVLAVPSIGLEYAELHEIITIAKSHWSPIGAALGKQRTMIPLLEHFERIRNTAAHSRELLPFEVDLMSGIAGEIRNKVTLHMTTRDPDDDPYPRIESVVDSYGDAVTIRSVLGEIAGSSDRRTLLTPGDIVTFTCVGNDARGRDLEWWTESVGGALDRAVVPSGSPATLEWRVADADVAESLALHIYLAVANSRYHRAHSFDHRVYFKYRVRAREDV